MKPLKIMEMKQKCCDYYKNQKKKQHETKSTIEQEKYLKA